jgi:hypothetical protein
VILPFRGRPGPPLAPTALAAPDTDHETVPYA